MPVIVSTRRTELTDWEFIANYWSLNKMQNYVMWISWLEKNPFINVV